jgi:hypothetical protein
MTPQQALHLLDLARSLDRSRDFLGADKFEGGYAVAYGYLARSVVTLLDALNIWQWNEDRTKLERLV